MNIGRRDDQATVETHCGRVVPRKTLDQLKPIPGSGTTRRRLIPIKYMSSRVSPLQEEPLVATEKVSPIRAVPPRFTVIEGGHRPHDDQEKRAALQSLVAEIRGTCRQRNQLLRAEIALSNQEFQNFCWLNPNDPKCKRRDREMGGGHEPFDIQGRDASSHPASGDRISDDTHSALVAADTVEGGQQATVTQGAAASLADVVSLPLIEARTVIHSHRKPLEKRLEKLAKELPVWPWVESVRGFGAVSLAQIIGETGDLSNYDNPAKVWKRMGLAVMDDGTRQRRVAGADAIAHGYVPRRRSVMFVIGDVLVKSNRDGEYRTLYLSRKEYEREHHPEMTPMQLHRRAQRYMEKRLLRDLWRDWRVTA